MSQLISCALSSGFLTTQTRPFRRTPQRFRVRSQDFQPSNDKITAQEKEETAPASQLADRVVEEDKPGNGLIAVGAVGFGVGLFLFTRVFTGGPSFADLEAQATPLNIAQQNGKPTVVEFYAQWCDVCREMLPDTTSVEKEYKDQINFVALNVENTKWAPEMLQYGVDGIPHFVFLNSEQNTEGVATGRVPKRILAAEFEALMKQQPLPYKQANFETSSVKRSSTSMSGPSTMPRDHGP